MDGYIAYGMMESELSRIRNQMKKGDSYDWQDKYFQAKAKEILDDFYARHPEIVRGNGNFAKLFPEKEKAVWVLNNLSKHNRINPEEFLILYNQIFAF